MPEIHGGETHSGQEVGPKFQRKVHQALKRTVSFWKEIQALFTACGVDGQTTSDHISRLNQEIVDDLVRCPQGTKRTKAVAETMHLAHRDLKVVAEVFNPGCFERAVHKYGLSHVLAFDLQLGDDLLDEAKQLEVKQYIRTAKPGLTVISPPCEMYSQLQNLLKDLRSRKPESMEKYLKKKRIADRLLHFAIDIALLCVELNLSFVLEHPWSASSWKTAKMKHLLQLAGIHLSRCDQCMTGLQSESGSLFRKRTGLATNNETIAKAMNINCDKNHSHEHIIGGHKSKGTQVYTENLKERIVKAYKRSVHQELSIRSSHDVVAENACVDAWMLRAIQPLGNETDPEPMTEKFSNYDEPRRSDFGRAIPTTGSTPDCERAHQDLYPAEVQPSGEERETDGLPDLRDDHDPHPGHQRHSGLLPDDLGLQPLQADGLQPGHQEHDGLARVPDQGRKLPGQRPLSLTRLIQRAHEGLGHPHKERFLRILRFSNANKEVMDAARNFTVRHARETVRSDQLVELLLHGSSTSMRLWESTLFGFLLRTESHNLR